MILVVDFMIFLCSIWIFKFKCILNLKYPIKIFNYFYFHLEIILYTEYVTFLILTILFFKKVHPIAFRISYFYNISSNSIIQPLTWILIHKNLTLSLTQYH